MTDLRTSGKSPAPHVAQQEMEMLRAENERLRNQVRALSESSESNVGAADVVDGKRKLGALPGEVFEWREGIMCGGKRVLARQAGAFATRLSNLGDAQRKMFESMPNLMKMTREEFNKMKKGGHKKLSALFESLYVSAMLQVFGHLLMDIERDSHFEDDPDTLWMLVERAQKKVSTFDLFEDVTMEGKFFGPVEFGRDSYGNATVVIEGDGGVPFGFCPEAMARVNSSALYGWWYNDEHNCFRFKLVKGRMAQFLSDVKLAHMTDSDLMPVEELHAHMARGFYLNEQDPVQTDGEDDSDLASDDGAEPDEGGNVTQPPSPKEYESPPKREREEEEEEQEQEPKRHCSAEMADTEAPVDLFDDSEPQLELELES